MFSFESKSKILSYDSLRWRFGGELSASAALSLLLLLLQVRLGADESSFRKRRSFSLC